MKAPDVDTLMARIYRHYPRGIGGEDRRHFRSEETSRLECVLQVCAANMGKERPIKPYRRVPIDPEVQDVLDALRAWLPFKKALQREFPDRFLWDRTIPWHNPCYICDVARAGYVQGTRAWYEPVVCMLSALAPVYALCVHETEDVDDCFTSRELYSNLPSQYADREARMAALIEETFHFTRLTEDTLLLSIPDVVPQAENVLMGEARLVDCLFTTAR